MMAMYNRRRLRKGMVINMRFVYPNGLAKALTFSYDDAQIFDRRLADLFRKYGMKATFHLNSGTLDKNPGKGSFFIGVDELAEVYAGHEIACHGLQHRNPGLLTQQQLLVEVYEDRKNLESYTGKMVQGMSYAFGVYDQRIIDTAKTVGIKYSRTVNSTYEFHMPTDFMQLHPTCHHGEPMLMELGERFLHCPDYYELPMMYVWGHSFEFGNSGDWSGIEAFCEKMAGKDDIWYATNMEIVDYVNAVRGVVVSADGLTMYNPSVISVWMKTAEGLVELKPGETKYIGEH